MIVVGHPLWGELPRFENSRNVEMTTSAKFARGLNDGFQRFEKFARFALVLEPIPNDKDEL